MTEASTIIVGVFVINLITRLSTREILKEQIIAEGCLWGVRSVLHPIKVKTRRGFYINMVWRYHLEEVDK